MRYLRYQVEIAQPYSDGEQAAARAQGIILPNRDVHTDTLILTILRAPRQGGISTADVVARAKIERDLNRSMDRIEACETTMIAFEDERAEALRRIVQSHSWGGYALSVAEFIEAVESMPSEVS